MVGWLTFSGGRRISLAQTSLRSLPVLRVALPTARKPETELRQIKKGAKLLVKAGCRRILAPPGFPHWPVLAAYGLRPVDPEPLCQALAAPLVLAALARRGLEPQRASVSLWGGRVNRAFFEAAQALCPQVRTLTVSAPDGGADLRRFLREEYGVAALEAGAGPPADLAAAFSPPPVGIKAALRLYGPDPALDELVLRLPENPLPQELDPLPALALLWDEGRVCAGEIEVSPTCGGESHLTAEEKIPIISS